MTRRISTLAAAALLVIALAPLSAQPPADAGVGGPHDDRGAASQGGTHGPDLLSPRFLARYLELTEEQREELKGVFQAHQESLRPIREETKALSDELRELVDSETPDPTAIGEVVLDLKALRDQAAAAREFLLQDVRDILTPSQQEKLDVLLEIVELLRERGPGGRR